MHAFTSKNSKRKRECRNSENKMRITLKTKVFQIGLHIILDILLYGKGRKLLKSIAQTPERPPSISLTVTAPTVILLSNRRKTKTKTNLGFETPDLETAIEAGGDLEPLVRRRRPRSKCIGVKRHRSS